VFDMAYRMARMPMTLSETEGHVCCYDWQTRRAVPVHLQSFLFLPERHAVSYGPCICVCLSHAGIVLKLLNAHG